MTDISYAQEQFERYAQLPTVEVEIAGERHQVPERVTVLAALWYAGYDVLKGAGCLGGACGACTTTYKLPNDMTARTGLGCQVVVQEGMTLNLYPIDPPMKPRYPMAQVTDDKDGLFAIYPETRRCTLCDSCTLACPQDIPVKSAVMRAMNGMFEPVSEMFDECVMCGFCTLVCEVGIAPNLLGIYARKVQSKAAGAPAEVIRQIEAVQAGAWDEAWQPLFAGGPAQVAERCRAMVEAGFTN
ncbi:MAG: 4Fe-4S dicluster domain-containing protein [Leptospirillia bacterium]